MTWKQAPDQDGFDSRNFGCCNDNLLNPVEIKPSRMAMLLQYLDSFKRWFVMRGSNHDYSLYISGAVPGDVVQIEAAVVKILDRAGIARHDQVFNS